MKTIIPIAQPLLGKEEEELVLEGIRSGWVSSIGKYIEEFEEKFAAFCGVKYGISTSNGTTALHLALATLGIGPGDEVIIPSLTFIATANAVTYVGAKPIFVDVEMDTWNIDPEKIKEKINSRTKAIIPVHLYGHPVNMQMVQSIARKYNLFIIEDAAEAHGAEYRGKRVGGLGDCACFSFFGNKIITTGEGGMIVTNNRLFAERAKMLRGHGASKSRKYYHPQLGFNYRMTNLQAALGVAQLKKIDSLIKRKREIAKLYIKNLSNTSPDLILQSEMNWAKNVFWMFSIVINNNLDRSVFMQKLRKFGVDSRPFFYPMHKHGRYRTQEKLPVSEFLGKKGINLPSSVTLKDEQINYICESITKII